MHLFARTTRRLTPSRKLVLAGATAAILAGALVSAAQAASTSFTKVGYKSTACSPSVRVTNPATQMVQVNGNATENGEFFVQEGGPFSRLAVGTGNTYSYVVTAPKATGYRLCYTNLTPSHRQASGTLTITII